jgi:NADH:ubiquinone oxidoreductase subunit D
MQLGANKMTRSTRNVVVRPERMLMASRLNDAFTFIGGLFSDLGTGLSACIRRFVEGLHKTRQRQAIELIRRNRDLIYESDTDICSDAYKKLKI